MRPDDAISGDCLIIDSLALIFQNKAVVVNTALHQTAGQERRVKVNLVLCQFDRGHGSHGISVVLTLYSLMVFAPSKLKSLFVTRLVLLSE